ncbi:MAG TPA: hypothetical protein DCS93_31185 [Microscillaceae bacterium]|nr:hypothetical protein [Microscillaceae bacterium]
MEKYNVLVVNQDFKSLHTIFDYLEEEGNYNVMNATNSQMVQIIIRKKELDVVLLDWETSIASELEVYHYLQQQKSTRNLPIVISTHPARTQTINEIITTDIAGFVPKPIEKPVLIQVIQQAIIGQKEAKAKKAEEMSALELARRKVQEEQDRIAEEKQQVESNKHAILEEQKRLQAEVERERTQLAEVKAKLDQEKAVLDTSQSDIEVIRQEVAASQEELQKKQEQLYATRKQVLEDQERLLQERQELAEAKVKLFKEKETALQEKQLLEQDTEAERQALEIARQQLEVEMQLLAEDRRQLDEEQQQLEEEMEKVAVQEEKTEAIPEASGTEPQKTKESQIEEPKTEETNTTGPKTEKLVSNEATVEDKEPTQVEVKSAKSELTAEKQTEEETSKTVLPEESERVEVTPEKPKDRVVSEESASLQDEDKPSDQSLENEDVEPENALEVKLTEQQVFAEEQQEKPQKALEKTSTAAKREPTSEEKDAEMVLDALKQAKEEVTATAQAPSLGDAPDKLAMERAQLEEMRQQLIKAKEGFEEEREKFAQEKEQILMENSKAREGSQELNNLQKSVLQAREQLSRVERELTQKQAKLKLIEMEEKASERSTSAIPAQLQKATEEADFSQIAHEGNSFSKLLEEEAARLHTSSLMQYILPEEIAKDLEKADYEFINYYPSVSILYIGFADLMSTVLKTDRSSLIGELEDFFKAINDRVQEFGLERVRTKNNMYACAQRQLSAEDPKPLLEASFEIRKMALDYKAHSQEVNDLIKKMYLGVNTTDVVAGDTHRKRFAYDIWSDIIQTTYHLKQKEDVPIHLLENTYKLVQNEVNCVHVGKVRTNRRGDWKVYELISLGK